jgi:phosphoglycolate phosphatase-like HAD superfamily hydrolase
VVIGDREDDIRAAHDNGLKGVGASYGYGRDGELAEADALASSASELPTALERLLSAATPD